MKIEEGKDYLLYVSTHGCLVCGQPNPDRDHLDTIGMGGNRNNDLWEDFSAVPLCRGHHQERHINMEKFEKKYRINLWRESHKILMRWLRYERN